jgi:hypothetical protein
LRCPATLTRIGSKPSASCCQMPIADELIMHESESR